MDFLDIIIWITITMMGTVFGSFFTLAVHRIPKKEDITHERSYCPNCNHKLNFLDLIPVFSYMFLGARCRYCKNKIRPRYFILEISSGLVFLLLALSYGIGIQTSIYGFISFAILILFLCSVFITAGIDRERYIIPNGVTLYGLGIAIVKVCFEFFVLKNTIYTNVIGFLALPLLLLFINFVMKKCLNLSEEPFGMGDIKYLAVIGLFVGFGTQIMILELSLLIILIYQLIKKLLKQDKKQIAWGYYLSIATLILIILTPHITSYIEAFNFLIMD